MGERKVIQIAAAFDSGDGSGECRPSYQPATELIALCDDGTLWRMPATVAPVWHPLPPIPQSDDRPPDAVPMTAIAGLGA